MTATDERKAAPRRPAEEPGDEGTANTSPAAAENTRADGLEDTPDGPLAEYVTGEYVAAMAAGIDPYDTLDTALDPRTAKGVWLFCRKFGIDKPETLDEVPVIPVGLVEHYLGDVPTRTEVAEFVAEGLDPTDPHDAMQRLKRERAERFRERDRLKDEQAELDARDAQRPARPKRMADRMLTLTQLAGLPAPTPLIDGLLYRNTLAQLAGEPGTGKTFAALAMACAVATAVPLGHHRVPEAGAVVYVAAEGANGLHDRIAAWCAANTVDMARLDKHLHVLPEPVQLGDAEPVAELTLYARRVRAALVVLDTRARCTVGLEENSATDMGRAIDAAERIRAASEATVLVVHHTAKGSTTPRGSTAWDGALWTDLRLTDGTEGNTKGGTKRMVPRDVTITCHKHKDAEDGCTHTFRLDRQTIPTGPESLGLPRESLVLTAPDPMATPEPPENYSKVLEALADADVQGGMTVRQIHDETGVSESTVRRQIKRAVDEGAVRRGGAKNAPKYTLTATS